MQFAWFFALVLALIGIVAAQNCPAPFKLDGNKLCTVQRTIRGECPAGSEYKVNVNKCVYGARG